MVSFIGDSDFQTTSLVSAGSDTSLFIVIGEVQSDEWHRESSRTYDTVEHRLRRQLNRNDIYILRMSRVEVPDRAPAGASFAEFRRQYQPPSVIYACPSCPDGDAVKADEFTREEFERSGGTILSVDGIELRSE